MNAGSRPRWSRPGAGALGVGAALLAWAAALAWFSQGASSGSVPAGSVPAVTAAFGVAAGALVLLILPRGAPGIPLWWIVVAGLLPRVVLLSAPPLQEDDYYRYLWDGAVTARGLNPYAHTPLEVREALRGRGTVPTSLLELGREAGAILDRVNHPHLTTVYPPAAQFAFASAHRAFPWSLPGWRAVLLLFDGATLGVVILLLRELGRPLGLAAWYWWNPLLVLEVSRNGHLEPLVLLPATAAVLLAVRRRFLGASALAALATAAKVWPLLLLPVLLRPLLSRPRRLAGAAAVFLALSAAAYLPLLAAGSSALTGYLQYGRSWENNDGFFRVLVAVGEAVLPALSFHPGHAQALSRWVAAALVAAWTFRLLRRPVVDGADMVDRCLLALAALFLLGPTQFPWYFLWLLPFLATAPRGPLLLYVALLPLYYLHYDHPGVLWIEHLPVWLLLARKPWRRAFSPRTASGAAEAP